MSVPITDKYQKMVLSIVARKLGPAAEPFVHDVALKSGRAFTLLKPENVEPFAAMLEIEAKKFVPETDAQFLANVVRKLKG